MRPTTPRKVRLGMNAEPTTVTLHMEKQVVGGSTWLKPGEFALLMQRELDENTNKGNWSKWRPGVGVLINELMHHVGKLCIALWRGDPSAVTTHAADAANYCSKMVELYGRRG